MYIKGGFKRARLKSSLLLKIFSLLMISFEKRYILINERRRELTVIIRIPQTSAKIILLTILQSITISSYIVYGVS